MTNPDWVPTIRRAAAVVTDGGGMTCHAAIVSRELGVPCVVGTRTATQSLRNGELVTVDGAAGKVLEGAAAPSATPAIRAAAAPASHGAADEALATLLYVNLAIADQAEAVAALPVDGVGLLRAEFLVTDALGGVHPRTLLAAGRQRDFVDAMTSSLLRITRQGVRHGGESRSTPRTPVGWRGLARARPRGGPTGPVIPVNDTSPPGPSGAEWTLERRAPDRRSALLAIGLSQPTGERTSGGRHDGDRPVGVERDLMARTAEVEFGETSRPPAPHDDEVGVVLGRRSEQAAHRAALLQVAAVCDARLPQSLRPLANEERRSRSSWDPLGTGPAGVSTSSPTT
jgi:hypothetical protein